MNVHDFRVSAAIPATTIEVRLADHDVERIVALIVDGIGQTAAMTEQWLDVAGAAAHLGFTKNAIRGLVKRRQLPFHRTKNGRLLFSMPELDHWVRTGSCEPADKDLP